MLRSSILYSRGHFAFVDDLRFTSVSRAQLRRMLRQARARQRVCCRHIGRYVPWNCLFPNANIARMERDAHTHVDTPDSCLHSTAALRGVHRYAHHSIYVGTGQHGWMWAGAQRSTLVLGPPRSGKTSSLVIPNILLSDGPVVSTSTKPDVMRATATSRSCDGWAFLYDPSGEIDCPPGVERVGWSPLTTATNWDAAVVTADAMVGASRLSTLRVGRAPLDRACGRPPLDLAPCRRARRALDAGRAPLDRSPQRRPGPRNSRLETPERTHRRPICSPGSSPPTPVSSRASGPPHRVCSRPIEPRVPWRRHVCRLSTSRRSATAPNTLYLCSTGRRQRQFAPLVVAIVGDVRDAAYARARDERGGPPTLLALDEVANIAPIPDLPAMVSEGAGQGLLVLACLQDLSQARAAGARRPTGSSRSSAPPSSSGASPTPRRCATSARWPATGRWRRPRSAGRSAAGGASAPRRRSAGAHQARAPRRRRGPGRAPGRALVLGPDKEVRRGLADAGTRALALARAGPARSVGRQRPPASAAAAESASQAELDRGGLTPSQSGPCHLELPSDTEMVGEAARRQRRQAGG